MAEGGCGGSGAAPDTGHTSGGQPTAPNSTGLLPLSPPKAEVDDSPLQKSMDKNKECEYRFTFTSPCVNNALKPELLRNSSVLTSEKTQRVSITKISWFILLTEATAAFSGNLMKPINTKSRVIDC
jgi:hypothetical protein